MEFEKRNELKKHLDYLKINFTISYKKLFEYKTNMISGLIAQFFYMILGYFFLFLFSNSFADVINWSFLDFIFFFTLNDTLWCLGGIFFWNKRLFNGITQGTLNDTLFRPLKPFFTYYFRNINEVAILMTLSNFPVLLACLYLLKPNIIHLVLFIIISAIVILSFVITDYFLNSFEFYFKKMGLTLSYLYGSAYESLTHYPFQFFLHSRFKFFLLTLGTTFTASIIVPILRNTSIWNLKIQIIIFTTTIIILTIGTIINWRYGLKKYEAFG